MPQQPTDFWLDTYTIDQVFDTPELISSLAQYSEHIQEFERKRSDYQEARDAAAPQSLLFLRVQAAASYYTTNRTLMLHPEPVDVDISMSEHHDCRSRTDATSSRPLPAKHTPAVTRTRRDIYHRSRDRSLVSLRLHLLLASLHRR